MDCTTTNDGRLPLRIRSQRIRDAESGCAASHRDRVFLVALAGSIDRIRTIELQGFSQSNLKRFQQFLTRRFLAIDAGDFLDPSDPPVTLIFHNSIEMQVHEISLLRKTGTDHGFSACSLVE